MASNADPFDALKLTPTQQADRLREVEKLIEGYENGIRCVRSDMRDDTGYERRKADLERTIARLTKQLADLVDRRESGPQRVVEYTARIAQLKAERDVLRGGRDLQRLMATGDGIEQLMAELNISEITPEVLAALEALSGE